MTHFDFLLTCKKSLKSACSLCCSDFCSKSGFYFFLCNLLVYLSRKCKWFGDNFFKKVCRNLRSIVVENLFNFVNDCVRIAFEVWSINKKNKKYIFDPLDPWMHVGCIFKFEGVFFVCVSGCVKEYPTGELINSFYINFQFFNYTKKEKVPIELPSQ